MSRARRPFLADALSVLLPTEDETWLLRACLLGGEAGRIAWETWQARIGDVPAAFRDDRLGSRRLLPLLGHVLRQNDALVGTAPAPYLRAAMAHEQLRGEAYSRIANQVLSTLCEAGIDFVALKGVALSEAVYGTWSLRHSHDVDLLVREDDLERAATLLGSRGFAAGTGIGKRHAEVRHGSGMPVKLHAEPFRLALFPVQAAELWERSRWRGVAGVPARVLSPADALLHVCGQAACCRGRESLQWAVDAWHVISRQPDLDWDMLVEVAARADLALPLAGRDTRPARGLGQPLDRILGDRSRQRRAQILELHPPRRRCLARERGGVERMVACFVPLVPRVSEGRFSSGCSSPRHSVSCAPGRSVGSRCFPSTTPVDRFGTSPIAPGWCARPERCGGLGHRAIALAHAGPAEPFRSVLPVAAAA